MSVPKLSDDEITRHMAMLPDWSREGETLTKQYQFKDFTHALQFVNQLAETAESVNHHPDIDIRYNKVKIVLTTHDSGGITKKDIELAASADDTADAIAA